MKTSAIPVDELRGVIDYDPKTGIFTNKGVYGSRRKLGSVTGTPNDSGYLIIKHKAKPYRAHRIAWEFVYGAIPDGMFIDHINGIKTDNRIANLRLATNSQNAINTKCRPKRALPKGVCFSQSGARPFRAFIMVNKKQLYLGQFYTEADAAKAYNDAAETHFGEFVPKP